jgi:ribonuclease Y
MFELYQLIIIGWFAIMGILVGRAIAKARSRRTLRDATTQAKRLTDEASQRAVQTVKEGETRAREEALQVRREAESLERQSSEQNVLLEERVQRLEGRNEKREADIAKAEGVLESRQAEVTETKDQAQEWKQEARSMRHAYRDGLEEQAGETARQIQEQLTEAMAEETRAQCADRLRNLETAEAEELVRQAKRIMGIALNRCGRRAATERVTSTLALPEGATKRLAPHLTFLEQETGVHLAMQDEKTEAVRLEGGDGAARELCRRAVTRFVSESSVRDPSRLLKSISAELDREILELGRDAFKVLGLEPAHREILQLVGRLNFRTSYTQNQWRHSIESAFIAGLMASELGLDVQLARRATLLHDIGKALTHEIEGSHAVIGADYARRFGEDEVVSNAVGSHHGDEPAGSPYAHLVAAADAMSGARPGARREMMETYVERIADLERIATGFPGVLMVHAVQAGREIRVHVDEHKVDDGRAEELSAQIAARIAGELTFPGQIRVTVIREFKAVETAA